MQINRLKCLITASALFFCATQLTYARDPNSAYRPIDQDWHKLAKEAHNPSVVREGSVVENAIEWNAANSDKQQAFLATVPTWPNYETIKEQFNYLRDHQFLTNPLDLANKRTIPWRFPVDYCYQRAAAATSLYNQSELARPAKVFAFGNLALLSPYAPNNGVLSFWYHVAPIVRDQQTNSVYVLDPALNFALPSPLNNWLDQLVQISSKKEISVSICNGYAVSPGENCKQATSQSETTQVEDLVNRLPDEMDILAAKGVGTVSEKPYSPNSFTMYGSVQLYDPNQVHRLTDELLVQYKGSSEENWHTVMNVGETNEKMNFYSYFYNYYFKPTRMIPIGSVFGNPSRAESCQCTYYTCACTTSNNEEKIDFRILLNNKTIKQCTYQKPSAKMINNQFAGPDIHYQFTLTNDEKIATDKIVGGIDGCN